MQQLHVKCNIMPLANLRKLLTFKNRAAYHEIKKVWKKHTRNTNFEIEIPKICKVFFNMIRVYILIAFIEKYV